MRLLLDTHVFLWYISGDDRLPRVFRDAIRTSNDAVFLSVVSLWEAIIKYSLGKLPLPQAADVYLPAQRDLHIIASLPLDEGSVLQLSRLPLIHRDPFDRMLICQAKAHQLAIVTVDNVFHAYAVPVLSCQ